MKRSEIANLVRANLAFFQMNRLAERKLGLSMVQYHLLVVVKDRPGLSSQQLAVEIGTHPSTLTQSIRRLLAKSALFVAPHPKDSRRKTISLTRVGLALIDRFEGEFGNLLSSGSSSNPVDKSS